MRPTQAVVSAAAIAANAERLARLAPEAALCAVVKADGYGHGAATAVRAALQGGASWLAVATLEEAVEAAAAADESGSAAPVLILSEVTPAEAAEAARTVPSRIRFTVASARGVEALASAGAGRRVHLKVDTGMHRMGATAEQLDDVAAALRRSSRGVRLEGAWTHFADADTAAGTEADTDAEARTAASTAAGTEADTDAEARTAASTAAGTEADTDAEARTAASTAAGTEAIALSGRHASAAHGAASAVEPRVGSGGFTGQQLRRFDQALAVLRAQGLAPTMTHAANSAGLLAHPRSHLDMVRVGIALYGVPPAPALAHVVELEPALSLVSRVTAVRTVPRGESVSYGRHWHADAPTRVATVPIGYADGIRRHSGPAGVEALVRGRRCPIVGVVTMDQLMVAAPGEAADDIAVDDEVVLLGRQGSEEITAGEIAERLGTIAYEVITALSARIPRRAPRVY